LLWEAADESAVTGSRTAVAKRPGEAGALVKLSAIALGCALSMVAQTSRANPLDTFGFGSRGTAMGGAVSADVADGSANYYNPAGIARAKGFTFQLGYFRAGHQLKINGNDNHVDPVKGLNADIALPGKLLGLPVAVGIALHMPDDRISRVRALRQEQPRWELYDNRNQRLYVAANLALRPWHWLEIGGGLAFMASARGRIDITGTANIFSPYQSQLRNEVDADVTAVRYPQAGALVHLSDRVALSAVYRGESSLKLDIGARLKGDLSGLTQAYYTLHSDSVNAFVPRQVVIGSSFQATRDLHANFDLAWVEWSAYVSPVANLEVGLDIPPPKGGWPPNISPPTTPARTHIVPIAMRDRLVPHLGLEWRALASGKWEGFLRGGYEFAKSPIGPQRGLTNFVDRDRHSLGLGVGARVNRPIDELTGGVKLDLHLQWSKLVEAVTLKDNAADFVGDYTAGGTIVNVGATLGVDF
jgi:hypothetical protein